MASAYPILKTNMVSTETEEMLVIVAGGLYHGIDIEHFKRLPKHVAGGEKEVAQREKDEAYVKELKRVIDQKNEELQRQIDERQA